MAQHRYRFLIIFVALALAACQPASAQTAAPQTAVVQRGSLTATVNSAGTVAAAAQVTLAFQTSGVVKEVDVKTGDQVKAGQVLAKLDTTDLQLAVTQAQSNLSSAKTTLAQTQAGPKPADLASARAAVASAYAGYTAAADKNNLNNAQLTVARAAVDKAAAALQRAQLAYDWEAHNWLDQNPLNSQQKTNLDNAQAAYDLAQASFNQTAADINDSALKSSAAQLAQAQYTLDNLLHTPTPQALTIAQAGVTQAQASLDQAQTNLNNASIIAPFAGTVADVNLQPGQMSSASTSPIILADLSQLGVAVTLSEIDVPKVKIGQAADVTLDAVPGQTFPGVVAEVDVVGTTSQGVVNYPVTVVMTDTTGTVKPGMNASVAIVLEQHDNVLLVPNRAVRTTGRAHMVTVLYKGQLIDVPVQIGLSSDTQTEILSGLQEGDVVVLGNTTTTTGGGGGGGGRFIFGG